MTQPVSDEMRATIQDALDQIEVEENIRVLLAVESGSRAWGFHSSDSDYDVRFVYARPREWHYQLGKKRDVVERPIDAELDISGWELSKALELALSSNAVIAEWLQSPIVYQADTDAVSAMSDFTSRALSKKSVTWHYVSLLKRQQSRVYAPDGTLRVKRWFYMLRPALALRWLRLRSAAMPPMDLAQLRAQVDLGSDVSDAIDQMLDLKMAAHEAATMPDVSPVLDDLIKTEWKTAEAWLQAAPRDTPSHLWQEASRLHLQLSQAAFSI